MLGEPESKSQRMEREAREKEDADRATLPQAPRPITEQGFMQYMNMVEEARRKDQEQQSKFLQYMLL